MELIMDKDIVVENLSEQLLVENTSLKILSNT